MEWSGNSANNAIGGMLANKILEEERQVGV